MSTPSRPVFERIMRKVVKDDVSGCWNFMGHLNENGYGTISIGRRSDGHGLTHREIYKIFNGDIPKGMFVCHKCDNPQCCNPNHLFLGTPKDNMDDMWTKGRKVVPIGEQSYRYKLTTKQVEEIRKDNRTLLEIGKDYGIVKSHVSMIKNFKTRIYG